MRTSQGDQVRDAALGAKAGTCDETTSAMGDDVDAAARFAAYALERARQDAGGALDAAPGWDQALHGVPSIASQSAREPDEGQRMLQPPGYEKNRSPIRACAARPAPSESQERCGQHERRAERALDRERAERGERSREPRDRIVVVHAGRRIASARPCRARVHEGVPEDAARHDHEDHVDDESQHRARRGHRLRPRVSRPTLLFTSAAPNHGSRATSDA
jgi:hypothetical protein